MSGKTEPTAAEIDNLMAELEAELEGLDAAPASAPNPDPSTDDNSPSELDIDPTTHPSYAGAHKTATPETVSVPEPAPVAVAETPSEPAPAHLRKQASAQASTPDDDELAALEAELDATPEPVKAGGVASTATVRAEPEGKEAYVPLPEDKPIPVTIKEPTLAPPTPPVLVAVPPVAAPAAPSPIHPSGFTEEEISDPVSKAKAVKPTLNYYVDVEAFKRETAVSEANLDECMTQQSGLRAFYGAQAAQAEAQHARLKVRFEVLEAKLYDTHRKALTATGEKVTEKAVENAVKLDPQWLKAKNAVIEAETISNVNRSLVASLNDRVSMLMQLGADRREEFKLAGGVRTVVSPAEAKAPSVAARALAKAQQAAA